MEKNMSKMVIDVYLIANAVSFIRFLYSFTRFLTFANSSMYIGHAVFPHRYIFCVYQALIESFVRLEI